MMPHFLSVALLKMVTMFCTYGIPERQKIVYSLASIGCLECSCQRFLVLGQHFSKKENRSTGTIAVHRLLSVCIDRDYLGHGGSTGDTRGHPPSKAQQQKPGGAHYVAPNFREIFRFWLWGFCA